jgi:hypothetical protein
MVTMQNNKVCYNCKSIFLGLYKLDVDHSAYGYTNELSSCDKIIKESSRDSGFEPDPSASETDVLPLTLVSYSGIIMPI